MDSTQMSLAYLIIQDLILLSEDSSEKALRRALVGLIALVSQYPDKAISAYTNYLLTEFAPLVDSVTHNREYSVTRAIRGKPKIVHDRNVGLWVNETDMLVAQISLDFAGQETVES